MHMKEIIEKLIEEEQWAILTVIYAKGFQSFNSMITQRYLDDINTTLRNVKQAIEDWRDNNEDTWDFDSKDPKDYEGDVLEVSEEFDTELEDKDCEMVENI